MEKIRKNYIPTNPNPIRTIIQEPMPVLNENMKRIALVSIVAIILAIILLIPLIIIFARNKNSN